MKTICPKQTPSQRENSTQKSKDPLVKISLGKKVTRLVRNYLPSIGLVLLLACISIITYLGSVGIPRSVLDRLEEEARKQDIELEIGSARLGYGSGLSLLIRDTKLSVKDAPNSPSIELGRARFSFRVSSLLKGEVLPYLIKLTRASATIPSSEDGAGAMSLESIPLTCSISSEGVLQLATTKPIVLDHLQLNLKADLLLKGAEEDKPEDSLEPDEPTLGQLAMKALDDYQEYIDFVSDLLSKQDWTDEQAAEMSVSFNGINAPRSSFELSCPSLHYDGLSFAKVSMSANFSNDTLLIHNLTLKSDAADSLLTGKNGRRTSAVLQGGCNFKTLQISFNLESDMPLLSIASGLVNPKDFALIERIALSSKDQSEMMLKGDIQLKPDFSFDDATILGYILQSNVRIGDCHLNELVFSFFYKDGNFAVDKAEVKMGKEGLLHLSSHLREGKGNVDISANLTLEQLQELLTSPIFEIDFELPEGLSLQEPIQLTATAGMDSPDFAEGRLAMVDFLPEIDNLSFKLALPAFKFDCQSFAASAISGSIGRFYAFEPKESKWAQDVKLKFEMGEVHVDVSPKLGERELPETYKQICQGLAESLSEEGLPLSHDLAKLAFELEIEQITKKETAAEGEAETSSKLCLSALSAQASLENLRGEDYQIQSIRLDLLDFTNLEFQDIFALNAEGSQLNLEATGLSFRHQEIESFALRTRFEQLFEFKTDCFLIFNQAKGEMLSFSLDKGAGDALSIKDIHALVPSAFINEFLPKESWESEGVALGQSGLRIDGSVDLALSGASLELEKGSLELNIADLKRWGVRVKPNAERVNEISLHAKIDVYRGQEGEYLYTLPEFSIAQGERSLTGSAYCAEKGVIEFDVRSSLQLDTLDELIDDHLTHLIMRDFTTKPDSEVNIDNLKLTIDLRDGLGVKAHGDFELKNVDGLLGTYTREPDPNGTLNQEDIRDQEEYTQLQSTILHGTADVDVDVQMGARDPETGKLPLKKSQIDINNIQMTYDNLPWLSYKKIEGGVSQSSFTAKKVRIDTFENFVTVHQAKGTIYPDYSIGMYFALLRSHLEVLELTKPVDIDTDFCCFPISKTSKVEMDGVIMMASKPKFRFKLAGEEFPLNDFTGYIDFRKGAIYLDKLNARLGQGVVDAQVLLTLAEKGMGYDGNLILQGGNLREIAEFFENKQSNAVVSGECRFRSQSLNLDDLQAYGQVSIKDGDLLELRIFSPISDLINNLPKLVDSKDRTIQGELISDDDSSFYSNVADTTREYTAAGIKHATSGISQISTWIGNTTDNIPGTNYFFRYDLQHASASFNINDGVLISDDLVAQGCNLSVSSTLHIALKQMYLEANLWPDVSSILTIMLSPVTAISDGIIDIKLRGTFDKLKWTIHWSDWSRMSSESHAEFKQRTAHIKRSEKKTEEANKKP